MPVIGNYIHKALAGSGLLRCRVERVVLLVSARGAAASLSLSLSLSTTPLAV